MEAVSFPQDGNQDGSSPWKLKAEKFRFLFSCAIVVLKLAKLARPAQACVSVARLFFFCFKTYKEILEGEDRAG